MTLPIPINAGVLGRMGSKEDAVGSVAMLSDNVQEACSHGDNGGAASKDDDAVMPPLAVAVKLEDTGTKAAEKVMASVSFVFSGCDAELYHIADDDMVASSWWLAALTWCLMASLRWTKYREVHPSVPPGGTTSQLNEPSLVVRCCSPWGVFSPMNDVIHDSWNVTWLPLTPMHWLMSVQKKSSTFELKTLATKVKCSNCKTGHAKKQCKKILCKKCCKADVRVDKCRAHGKKPAAAVLPTAMTAV